MSSSQVKIGPTAGFGQRLHRLYRDLIEIRQNAHPGIRVFADDANILEFCLVLTPQSGPFKNLALHFDVSIPDNWPTAPPIIKSSVPEIKHPNIINGTICADALRLPSIDEKDGIYSSAFTLEGLFIQCLSFFSNNKAERKDGKVIVIGGTTLRLFTREVDISPTATPTTLHLSCDGTNNTRQTSYLAEWNTDKRPETTLETYISRQGRVIHKVKGEEKKWSRMHMFVVANPLWAKTMALNEGFRCARCPYGTEKLPCAQEPSNQKAGSAGEGEWEVVQGDPTAQAPSESEDALIDKLISRLSEESITDHIISADEGADLDHKLQCFFLRSPLASRSIILGVGVWFNFGGRTFTINFDFLSEAAFDKYKVRSSVVEKKGFDHFLPLAFSRIHFERAERSIWKRLRDLDHLNRLSAYKMKKRIEKAHEKVKKKILNEMQTRDEKQRKLDLRLGWEPWMGDQDPYYFNEIQDKEYSEYLRKKSKQEYYLDAAYSDDDDDSSGSENDEAHIPHVSQQETVEVLYTMMNNIVVSFVKSIEQDNVSTLERRGVRQFAYGSEQALQSYCLIFHLLICLSRKNVGILERTVDLFKAIVTDKGTNSRDKDHIPDLGELIVRLILIFVKPTNTNDGHLMNWENISGPIVQEMLIRNSKWILKGNSELEIWENGKTDKEVEYRLKKSFEKSKTSLRLLMFQLTFVDLFVAEYAAPPSESRLEQEGTSSTTIKIGDTTLLPTQYPKGWRSGLMKLDDNYGFPESSLLDKLMSEIPKITSIDSWKSFFQRVKMAKGAGLNNVRTAQLLKEAMYESERRGYHEPVAFGLTAKSGNTVISEGSDWTALLNKRRKVDLGFVVPEWLKQRGS